MKLINRDTNIPIFESLFVIVKRYCCVAPEAWLTHKDHDSVVIVLLVVTLLVLDRFLFSRRSELKQRLLLSIRPLEFACGLTSSLSCVLSLSHMASYVRCGI